MPASAAAAALLLPLAAPLLAAAAAGGGDGGGGAFAVPLLRHRRKPGKEAQPHADPSLSAYAASLAASYSYYARAREFVVSEYYGHVAVGSPGQVLRVVLDTGSGNLIVPSEECMDVACRTHARFDASASSTSKALASSEGEAPARAPAAAAAAAAAAVAAAATGGGGAPPGAPAPLGRPRDSVTVTFGTGEVTGVFEQDIVCVGEACTRMRFIAAVNESEDPFEAAPFDGILGLSLPQLAEGQGFCFMDMLVKAGVLARNVFSVFLEREGSANAGEEEEAPGSGPERPRGEVLFGAVRRELFEGPLTWLPVTNPGYWQVAMRDLTFGDEPLGLCGSGCQAALDTGTALVAGPPRLIRQLVAKLRVAIDCSNFDTLPDLGFILGNTTLRLAPADYVDRSPLGCALGLMALDIPPPRGPLFILGDPFLRKYYTVYDRERLRVGLAPARADATAPPSPQAPRSRPSGGNDGLPPPGGDAAAAAGGPAAAAAAAAQEGGPPDAEEKILV